jgi:hypothetical protein
MDERGDEAADSEIYEPVEAMLEEAAEDKATGSREVGSPITLT